MLVNLLSGKPNSHPYVVEFKVLPCPWATGPGGHIVLGLNPALVILLGGTLERLCHHVNPRIFMLKTIKIEGKHISLSQLCLKHLVRSQDILSAQEIVTLTILLPNYSHDTRKTVLLCLYPLMWILVGIG